jgi:hypothetical protein
MDWWIFIILFICFINHYYYYGKTSVFSSFLTSLTLCPSKIRSLWCGLSLFLLYCGFVFVLFFNIIIEGLPFFSCRFLTILPSLFCFVILEKITIIKQFGIQLTSVYIGGNQKSKVLDLLRCTPPRFFLFLLFL